MSDKLCITLTNISSDILVRTTVLSCVLVAVEVGVTENYGTYKDNIRVYISNCHAECVVVISWTEPRRPGWFITDPTV